MSSQQLNVSTAFAAQTQKARLFGANSAITISLLVLLCACISAAQVRAQTGLALAATNVFGGAGDQRALAVSINGNALYLSGIVDANGGDALAGRWTLPLTNNAAALWSFTWPGLAGGDDFSGMAVSAEGVYVAGSSYGRTSDTIGGKESKGITVKFPLNGPTGGGFGGSVWDRQTPAAPGAFGYGGSEFLLACFVNTEGGTPFIYATGNGQQNGANGGRLFISKLDTNGTVLWTRNDSASMANNAYSQGRGLTALNGYIYACGFNGDAGNNPCLRKYDTSGNLIWAVTGTNGSYNAVLAYNGAIFAVGENGFGAAANFRIDKWNEAGSLVWSRQFDRNNAEDVLSTLVALGGRFYAAGWTRGSTAGGADAAVLELDAGTGDLLSTTLYGGAQDDFANGIATDGSDLYVVGETRSFISGGNGSGQNDAFVLRYRGPATLAIHRYAGLTITGSIGATYRIDYANDLNNTTWTTLTNLVLSTSPYLFIDTDSVNAPNRFYRAVLVP